MNSRQEFIKARDFLLLHREDYRYAKDHFRWPKMDHFNWALDYFDPMAEGNTHPALWIVHENGQEEKYTFADLSARSNQVANFLQKNRVSHGDRVILMLNNEVALWEMMLACMKVGAVMVPTSPLLTQQEITDRMNRSLVKLVVTSTDQLSKFDTLAPQIQKLVTDGKAEGWLSYKDINQESTEFTPEMQVHPQDPLLLYFTSGTASQPKMVEHTYQSYPIGHLSTMYWMGLQPGDLHLNISSPGWAKHAWSSFFAPWTAEACVFVLRQEKFQAKAMLEALEKYQITTTCAPPTVWRKLVQENIEDYDVNLREAVSAGEPLNREIIHQVQSAWGIAVRDGYGQTETTAMIGNTPGQELSPGAMGYPLPGYDIYVIDGEGADAVEGEICLKLSSPPIGLMSGYRGDQVQSSQAMSGEFYHTGDIAIYDEDGVLTFVGRADDVFKSSDYRISPFELESILIEHEAIAEAAVVPSADAIRLYVPKAYVSLAAGYEATPELVKEIFEFSRGRLAPFKRIRRLEFMNLPKTTSGKIRRAELRLMEEVKRMTHDKSELEFWESDDVGETQTWAQDMP